MSRTNQLIRAFNFPCQELHDLGKKKSCVTVVIVSKS